MFEFCCVIAAYGPRKGYADFYGPREDTPDEGPVSRGQAPNYP